jgi:hypothetical protein
MPAQLAAAISFSPLSALFPHHHRNKSQHKECARLRYWSAIDYQSYFVQNNKTEFDICDIRTAQYNMTNLNCTLAIE